MPDLMRPLRALVPTRRRAAPRPVERKSAVLSAYYEALHAAGIPLHRTGRWNIERAVAEGYERSLWGFRCVDTISNHAANVPFQILDGEKPVKGHPLAKLLNGRANPLETGPQLRERLSAQVLLSPRGAFVEVTKSRGGDPIRLDLLPPGRTRPVPGDGDVLIEHFEVLKADGTRTEIEPEYVRWFRKPHPIDPYTGITPLEAAGFSIELDYFARLYNLRFLQNDGRPAGVIAIDGEMDPREMDRIEDRFGGGPMAAGELAVINGQLSYVDLAKTPRDAAYQVTTKTAKEEILAAFGVAESVLGNASGRTFSNAAEEMRGFWEQVMLPHFGLLSTGWDDDAGDDLKPGWDLSKIEALQQAKAARIEQARKDFQDGLISVDEYREISGLDPVDVPETRCLYLPSGKTRVATSEKDRLELLERDKPPAPELPAPPPQGELEPGQDRLALPAGAAPQTGDEPPPRGALPPRRTPPPLPPGRKTAEAGRPVLRVVRKDALPARVVAGQVVRESAASEQDLATLEQQLAVTLQTLVIRWTERTVARLRSPKQRAGTRHWQPSGPDDTRTGSRPVNAAQLVDGQTWQDETEAAVRPVLTAAAEQTARALVTDLTGRTEPDEEDGEVKAPRRRSVQMVVDRNVRQVVESAASRAEILAELVRRLDQEGAPLEDIVGRVRENGLDLSGWAQRVPIAVATSVVNGARDAAASQIENATVTRMWLSRRDQKVRATHRAADGQTQPVGTPFKVGGVRLDFPGDPDGPPEEVKNCRCRLLHRAVSTGRFVGGPPQVKLAIGGRHVPGTPFEWRHGWVPLTPQVAARWKKPWPPADGLAPADKPGRGGTPDRPRRALEGVNLRDVDDERLSRLAEETRDDPDAADRVREEVRRREADPLHGVYLEGLDDNEIADLFTRHGDDPDAMDRLMNEMQRRDDEDQEAARRGGYDPDAGDTEDDRRIAVLVGKGWDYKDAYAQVYDLDPADLDREERRAEAELLRLPGESIDDTVRRMYGEWVHLQWLEAEKATNGYLVRRGSNVDPVSLFSGPAHVARKHASEELLRWWGDHPRQTYQQFKAEILARASDQAGARATREGGTGREFGV